MVSLKVHQPATVLKVDKLQVVMVPELHPPISLNTEECPNQLDHNQPVQCQPSQVNFHPSRVVTVDHLFNLQLSTINLKWLMEVLLVLVVMVVVNNSLQLLNGTLLRHKILAMALVGTRVKHHDSHAFGSRLPYFMTIFAIPRNKCGISILALPTSVCGCFVFARLVCQLATFGLAVQHNILHRTAF
jgi:hypothetical protein